MTRKDNPDGNEAAEQTTSLTKKPLSPDKLKRTKSTSTEIEIAPLAPTVSAGPVDKVIELAFNPSRDKIREVTIIDRLQGRLFPLLDMVNLLKHNCLEIAAYRQDSVAYKRVFKQEKPLPPEPLDELIFRTAQWQKSVAGKNLERATDIALAETEIKAGENEESISADAWKD